MTKQCPRCGAALNPIRFSTAEGPICHRSYGKERDVKRGNRKRGHRHPKLKKRS